MTESDGVPSSPERAASASPAPSVVRGARRAAIISIVASLVIAAAVGIVALLIPDFGRVPGNVLLTAITVAAFGTTTLCHLAIVTRKVRIVGFVGIAASVGAAFCALVLIWLEWSVLQDSSGWWKALGVLSITAVSLAQANLLLLLVERSQQLIRIALFVTLVSIASVALLLMLPILSNGEIPDDGGLYWRVVGVLAILDALGTIALPILGLVLRRATAPEPATPLGSSPVVEPASEFVELVLPPELAWRVAAAAAAAGVPRDQFVVEVLARHVERQSAG